MRDYSNILLFRLQAILSTIKTEANAILRYKWLILSLPLVFVGCLFEKTSKISDDQAEIIRELLRANGYSISDNEWVDDYLEFTSSFPHADLQDIYWLVLPEKNHKKLVLTPEINSLNDKFIGISAPARFTDTIYQNGSQIIKSYGKVDTILIESDGIINVKTLSVSSNKLRTLPPAIKHVRARDLNISYNHITHLPEEIMQLTAPPVVFDSFHIYIDNNKIDTINISDTLDKWLKKYSGPYWKAGQQPPK